MNYTNLLLVFQIVLLFILRIHSKLLNDIRLSFFVGNHTTQYYKLNNFKEILNHKNFNVKRSTVLYLYGFLQTPYQGSVREIVDAYVENNQYNFILVNFDSVFVNTIFNSNDIAEGISDALLTISEAGVELNKIHIVGFSLGAHVAGLIGKKIKSKSKGSLLIGRITGLSPAKLFSQSSSDQLNENDAHFVDVIHTEVRNFGNANCVGKATFWVNNGDTQPNCLLPIDILSDICSHLMAPTLWAESLLRNEQQSLFYGRKCNRWKDFIDHKCEEDFGVMGAESPSSLRGNYILQTNSRSPFAKGKYGTIYKKT